MKRKCENIGCDNLVSSMNKYCSRKCYNDAHYKNIVCVGCSTIFREILSSKKIYCSNECASKHKDYKLVRKKSEQTLMERYGVNHPAKMKEHNDKVKNTRKEHYGDENYANPEKAKQTKLERYGDARFNNKEKAKQTNLIKYGNENYNNREKFKQTIEERYGNELYTNAGNRLSEMREMGLVGFDSPKFKKYLALNNVTNVSQLDCIKEVKLKGKLIETYNNLISEDGRLTKNNIIPLFTVDEYVGSSDYSKLYKFKCNTCGNIFDGRLYSGKIPRCFVCFPRIRTYSYLEKELVEFLKNDLHINDISENDINILKHINRELDIYLPEYKVAVEFDGLYWHSSLRGKDSNYHLNKTIECSMVGVELIHVFEDEWLFKTDIVKSNIKYILGRYDKIVTELSADYNISIVDVDEKIKFLNENDICGNDNSSIYIGLYYKNILIFLLTVNDMGNGVYELSRWSHNINCMVSSGFKMLVEYFIKTYNPIKLTINVDRRWNIPHPNVLYSLNFVEEMDSKPLCRYVDNIKLIRYSTNLILERDLNKYGKIWDCGCKKFVWSCE